MGYFPNGSAGDAFEAQYCRKCQHNEDKHGCAVWLAHMIHNYDECNNENSILHLLIPLDDEGFNKQCTMYRPKEWDRRQGKRS